MRRPVGVQNDSVVYAGLGAPNFRQLVRRAAIALVSVTLAAPAAAQGRLPDGGVATALGRDVVAAWYARPTERYGHAALGDAVEAGSLMVRDDRGVLHEVVLPEQYVFEDVTPRFADLEGDGLLEIVTIRTDVSAGAAVAVYGMSGGTLVQRAATLPIGQPNRWLSIAAIADFTGDGRQEIAVVRTPHIGGVLELLSLKNGALRRLYPSQAGYSSHTIGAAEVSFAAAVDVSGDGVADLILPESNLKRLVILQLVEGIVPIATVDLPAKVAGPIKVEGSDVLLVPLATGRSARVDLQ